MQALEIIRKTAEVREITLQLGADLCLAPAKSHLLPCLLSSHPLCSALGCAASHTPEELPSPGDEMLGAAIVPRETFIWLCGIAHLWGDTSPVFDTRIVLGAPTGEAAGM